jgi:beta-glucosidase
LALTISGLSYTTFKMENLNVSLTGGSVNANELANSKKLYDVIAWASIDVCNTGDVYGTEISQLYVSSPAEGAAPKVLRGFEAVHLSAGETKRVTFELTRRDLRLVPALGPEWKKGQPLTISYWNVYIAGWTLPQGQHRVYVGNSSRNVQQSANITLNLS